MYIVFLFLVGVSLGRLTTIVSGTRRRPRDHLNVCIGIVGALFGGLALARAIGAPTALNAVNGIAALMAAGTAGLLLLSITLLRNWIERRR